MLLEPPNPQKRIADQENEFQKFIDKELTATKQQIQEFFKNVLANDSKVKADFSCLICKGIIFQPRQCVKCGSARYCKICIDKHVDKNDDIKNPPKCFKCSKPIDCGNINPNSFQKFNAAMMTFNDGKKPVTMPYMDVTKYFTDNMFKKELSCPHGCGCKFDNLIDANKHFSKCPKLLMQCYACGQVHTFAEQEEHDAACPEKIIECPEKCECSFKRMELDEHMNVCRGARYECHLCSGFVNIKDKDSHICQNYLLKDLSKKFDNLLEMFKQEREFKEADNEDCLLMSCKCSVYNYTLDKVMTPGSPVVNKKCGVFCPKCNMVICAKHPGFTVNQLGNAVCFDCRKVVCKTDSAMHFCLDFTPNCQHCCQNFHHEMHACKTCGGSACWTCKTVFNEGMNGYFRINDCGIVCGDKLCKKIIRLAEDHKDSDLYRHSRYWYCKKCNNQIFW